MRTLRLGIWLQTAILFAAPPASALVLVQLSGSGDIEIEAAGSIWLETGTNVFDQISLAAPSLELGAAPAVPDVAIGQHGLNGYATSLPGDIAIEIVSWSGTLSVTAGTSLRVTGPLLASSPGDPGGSCDLGALVIGTGGAPLPDGCDAAGVVVGPVGGGIVVSGGGIAGAGPIPEPRAALLFGLGALVVSRARRG